MGHNDAGILGRQRRHLCGRAERRSEVVHVGRTDGTFRWAAGSGNVVGTGWGDFKQLFSGGDGIIYGVNQNNQLVWYRHVGRTDGSFRWAAGSGNVVGTGWAFTQLFGDD
jgi:hypothetical protein